LGRDGQNSVVVDGPMRRHRCRQGRQRAAITGIRHGPMRHDTNVGDDRSPHKPVGPQRYRL